MSLTTLPNGTRRGYYALPAADSHATLSAAMDTVAARLDCGYRERTVIEIVWDATGTRRLSTRTAATVRKSDPDFAARVARRIGPRLGGGQ